MRGVCVAFGAFGAFGTFGAFGVFGTFGTCGACGAFVVFVYQAYYSVFVRRMDSFRVELESSNVGVGRLRRIDL